MKKENFKRACELWNGGIKLNEILRAFQNNHVELKVSYLSEIYIPKNVMECIREVAMRELQKEIESMKIEFESL